MIPLKLIVLRFYIQKEEDFSSCLCNRRIKIYNKCLSNLKKHLSVSYKEELKIFIHENEDNLESDELKK